MNYHFNNDQVGIDTERAMSVAAYNLIMKVICSILASVDSSRGIDQNCL
jgi:hypothetical protein